MLLLLNFNQYRRITVIFPSICSIIFYSFSISCLPSFHFYVLFVIPRSIFRSFSSSQRMSPSRYTTDLICTIEFIERYCMLFLKVYCTGKYQASPLRFNSLGVNHFPIWFNLSSLRLSSGWLSLLRGRRKFVLKVLNSPLILVRNHKKAASGVNRCARSSGRRKQFRRIETLNAGCWTCSINCALATASLCPLFWLVLQSH